MGKFKHRACIKCGVMHACIDDSCKKCRRAEFLASRLSHCAMCGEKIPAYRLISPYCSLKCANEAVSISARAGSAVKKAIRKGDIAKITSDVRCVDCGDAAKVYDHRDYSKPLDVDPVCRSCNIKRGPANIFRLGQPRYMRDGSRFANAVA